MCIPRKSFVGIELVALVTMEVYVFIIKCCLLEIGYMVG